MVIIVPNGDAAIAGLRDQITANANILFCASNSMFNVIVVKVAATEEYRACIASREVAHTRRRKDPSKSRTVPPPVHFWVKGEAEPSAHEALSSLLEVTATKLGELVGADALDGDDEVV